jgi:essential nuclear protein 1
MFMSNKQLVKRKVADVIMEKLTEKKTELQSQLSDDDQNNIGGGGDHQTNSELDERIIKMYTAIKDVLNKYRSGKLPKAFKILPSLQNWEHVSHIC